MAAGRERRRCGDRHQGEDGGEKTQRREKNNIQKDLSI